MTQFISISFPGTEPNLGRLEEQKEDNRKSQATQLPKFNSHLHFNQHGTCLLNNSLLKEMRGRLKKGRQAEE